MNIHIPIYSIRLIAMARRPMLKPGAEGIILGSGYKAGGVENLFAGVPCGIMQGLLRDIWNFTLTCEFSNALTHALNHSISQIYRASRYPEAVDERAVEETTNLMDFINHPLLLAAVGDCLRTNDREEDLEKFIHILEGADQTFADPYRESSIRGLSRPVVINRTCERTNLINFT